MTGGGGGGPRNVAAGGAGGAVTCLQCHGRILQGTCSTCDWRAPALAGAHDQIQTCLAAQMGYALPITATTAMHFYTGPTTPLELPAGYSPPSPQRSKGKFDLIRGADPVPAKILHTQPMEG